MAKLSRRQLFIFGGIALGGGIAGAAQGFLFRNSAPSQTAANPAALNNPNPSASQPPAPSNTASKVRSSANLKPAPKGLYAPTRGDVRLVVISDLNSAYGSTNYRESVKTAIRLIPDWEPDLVLCGGDMVAAQSLSLNRDEVDAMWQAFDRYISGPLRAAKLPFGFTVGNHDGSGALSSGGKFTFQTDREAARTYWRDGLHDPQINFVDRGDFPFYYTFAQNEIFYLVWDASTATITKTQLDWAAQALSSKAAQGAKLRIVIGHLPLYGIAKGRDNYGNFLDDADELRRFLEKYKVHTYVSGHHHAYYPGHRGKLELLHAGVLGDGPRRLVTGNLPPNHTLTVVDIKLDQAETAYTTYDMNTLQVIDQSTLPPVIHAPNGKVYRRDVKET